MRHTLAATGGSLESPWGVVWSVRSHRTRLVAAPASSITSVTLKLYWSEICALFVGEFRETL